MDFPAKRAYRHVEQLAAKHDIEIREISKQWNSEAWVEQRLICIAKPNTAIRYMIALHEIGHIVDKVSAHVLSDHDPGCEAAAWAWAYDNADPKLRAHVTERHWQRIGRAWVSSLGKRSRMLR